MDGSHRYSIAVVGLGLIGSAACRYLSLGDDPSTILGIGAAESDDSTIFSSHYDQGRITRIVDADNVWSQLAARSMASYKDIETKSGIVFHSRAGFVRVSPFFGASGDCLAKALEVGVRNGARAEVAPSSQIPIFGIDDDEVAVVELGDAGFVNPREMARAQLEIAKNNGVRLVREEVMSIDVVSRRLEEGGGVKISTRNATFIAARVLIAAGAYTNFLVPRKLEVKIKAVTVLLAEIDRQEATRLREMPAYIWRLKSDEVLHSVYGCPPIEYPDGKIYLKIGGTLWQPRIISTREEFREWFRGSGCEIEAAALLRVLLRLVPGLKIKSVKTRPCVVSYSAHNYPYIDKLSDEIFVASFGCGAAAKSSDEIGKMASLLVREKEWKYCELDSSLFQAVFAGSESC